MKHIAWLFKWLLKAAIFFTLFAFALNNQHDVTVKFFFGYQWTTSLVLVVLSTFAIGLVVGALGMVPRWWRHRQDASKARILVESTIGQKLTTDPTKTSRPNGI
jgi:putative membrane protein